MKALAMLERPSFDAAPLLDALGRFVAGVSAKRRPQASSVEAQCWCHCFWPQRQCARHVTIFAGHQQQPPSAHAPARPVFA
ncbi:hypothetical protein [Ideonella sp. A 288]|uniref:hypothetical protein n=1 Tax=Ideonella sp. A 288 TaxID=1962181 RepID=UPI001F1D81A1|nr:hypothetical protein [Ideonella sp. A 288]